MQLISQIISQIKRWIAPPVFSDDEDKTRRAGMLNLALINVLILIPVLIIAILLGGKTPISVIGVDVLALAFCLVLYFWMRRGRIRLASIGLMALGFLGITAGIASVGTVRAPATAMYVLMVITAGLLFDLSGMIVATVLCSLLVAGLIMAGNAGLLPHPDYSLTITQWITYTAIFGWAGSLTFSALQSMHHALARADSELAERKLAETELAKHRDYLEELVKERTAELEEKNSTLTGEIAERKRVEGALRESEAKYRNLFMNMTEEVHFWKLVRDKDGRVNTWRLVDANPPTLKTWSKNIEEIKGKTTDEIFGPGATEHYMPVVRKIMTEGVPYSFEDYFPNLDKYFRFTSVPLGDYFITTGADITGIKKAQEELRKSRDELERRVLERTAELSDAKENLEVINEELQVEISEHEKTEKDLLKAKEAAEAAVEAKAAFLANMSHELRTPLNAVIGYSSLLLDDNLTQEQKESIESIRNGGEALLSIISDILEFSRAEKEKITLEHQPLSIKSLIEESLNMVAVHASNKGLNLAYTIRYGTPDTIIGDHGRLRQILTNLLTNAVKFTDKGDISVSVYAAALEGDKRRITFEVRDTGIGMPKDKMDMLFLPFTQLEYVISRKRDGAGLGLAICKKLVELMGGEISAESEEGRGSTFRFMIQADSIPGKRLDLEETGIDRDHAHENIAGQKPLSILVAEDNPSNQKVLVEMLKRIGYRSDVVADGKEVLQVLGIRPYDIVLMDIRMPEMDGITAAREIRRLWPAEKQPRIVAITAFAMEGDREKCLEAGMDDYIAKPVKIDELKAVLEKNLSGANR